MRGLKHGLGKGSPANIVNLPVQVKAGGPAASSTETRDFPTPPRDGCGFINFPFSTGKQGDAFR